ncbi:ABC transporter permease [Streptomyces sp. NPDC087844]|uniref:ABC transporter permease n=1 Tax=Streptomyces sp. NPDC087844 TaxID=3365805 RepID=UPI0038151998
MNTLVGTGKLVRLILRRDRWVLPLWILWLILIPVSLASAYQEQFPTAADRAEYARTAGTNPTFLALYGPLHDTSVGGIVAQRIGAIPLFIALISVLIVIRHTRTEEQAGRRELLSAAVCGRHAGLAAALAVTMVANLVVGLFVGLGLRAELPASGSLAVGLGFAAVGCVFAAVGGLAAQFTENAGSARGIAIGGIGAFFLIRLAADTGGEDSGLTWLNWLSPLGWVTEMRAFADERWWIALLFAVCTVLVTLVAVLVSSRRDIGGGLLAARLGPPDAPSWLGSPLGLAWRLHRTLLAGWLVTFAVLGAVFGGIAEGIGDLMKDNENLKDVFARMGGQQGLIDSYIASMMSLVGLVAAAYGIQAALKLRSEEEATRAEYLLTTTGRTPWVLSHLVFALLGPTAGLAVAGVSAGLVHGANSGDIGGQTPPILGAAMVQLPAVWVLSGLALALFALLPRMTAAAWGALGLCGILGQFGRALEFDQKLLDISPFTHVPQVPGNDLTLGPILALLAIAAAFIATGLVRTRHRDISAA